MTGHDLSRLEKRLAAEWEQTPIPASIESAVMRHFDRARSRRRVAIAGVLAVAASIAIAIVALPRRQPLHTLSANRIAAPAPQVQPVETPAPPRPVVSAPLLAAAPAPPAAFVAIPYAPPLEAHDRATVVRMALTLPALAAAGLPIIAGEPDTLAQADVLVGEDGQPRAIRLVSLSTQ